MVPHTRSDPSSLCTTHGWGLKAVDNLLMILRGKEVEKKGD